MLTSISKLADKAFVIGFLLPALVFFVVYGQTYGCPGRFATLCSTLHSDEPFAKLTYFALAVWFGAVLLLALNYFVYRLYEGYFAIFRWLKFPLWLQKRRYTSLCKKLENVTTAYERAKTVEPTALATASLRNEASAMKRTLRGKFPAEQFLLPTQFGNRLRAFETYSYEVYGADAIPIWPRLSSVMPASCKTEIETARSQVNFFLNLSALSWLLAIISFGRLACSLLFFRALPTDSRLDFAVLLFAVLAALIAYYVAVAEIDQWGETVRSAFDCYLPALAVQLGYDLPKTEAERWKFWQSFTKLFLYRRRVGDGWTWVGSGGSSSGDTGSSDGLGGEGGA